jgi:hypothetical protein
VQKCKMLKGRSASNIALSGTPLLGMRSLIPSRLLLLDVGFHVYSLSYLDIFFCFNEFLVAVVLQLLNHDFHL